MSAMRIYVFKSETRERLCAFAGNPDVNKLSAPARSLDCDRDHITGQ